MSRLVACIVSASVALACGGAPPPVELTNQWPDRAGDYEEVTERWTRHGRDHAAGDDRVTEQIIDVYATFKSPEWRAAHLRFLERRHQLPAAELAARREKAQADAADAYEVHLLVATYDPRSNDLHKGERSTWRVALVDGAGNEIVAEEIRRDRRRRSEIAAEFPHLGDFHEPYVARFPRTIDLLRPEAERFSLKVTSAQGGVVLTWAER